MSDICNLEPSFCEIIQENHPLCTKSASFDSLHNSDCLTHDIAGQFPPIEYSRKEHKRGRPKAAVISDLILKGSNTVSNIKCKFCCRVFPREKSLQAHLRTHTGKFYP